MSVIVPAYNSATTLKRAVDSALAQQHVQLELIIVDDGSVDSTAEVAGAIVCNDSRARLISLPRNRGKSSAMNVGVAEARGDWIGVLDADDWYAPTRLHTLLATAARENVDLVADNQFLYDDGAECVVRTAFPVHDGDRTLDKRLFAAGSNPYADFDFGMLKPLVRSDFIRRSGLTYRESVKLSEDFLYLVEFLSAGGRAFLVAEPLYYWRQAFGSISRRWTETGDGSWRYNFLSAAAANADLLRVMRSRGQEELSGLLESRMRAFLRLHLLQELSRLRAGGAAPMRVAGQLIAHPSIWPLVMQRGVRRLKQRLPHLALQRA